jgi:hypothetical protein
MKANYILKEQKCIIKHDRQRTYIVTLKSIRVTTVAMEKAVSITYSECAFAALVIQHAKRMYHATLLTAACLGLPYFHIITSTAQFPKKNKR